MQEILGDDTIRSFIKYKMEVCKENNLDVEKDDDYNRLLAVPGYIEKLAEIKRYFNDFRDLNKLPYWDTDSFDIETILTRMHF